MLGLPSGQKAPEGRPGQNQLRSELIPWSSRERPGRSRERRGERPGALSSASEDALESVLEERPGRSRERPGRSRSRERPGRSRSRESLRRSSDRPRRSRGRLQSVSPKH